MLILGTAAGCGDGRFGPGARGAGSTLSDVLPPAPDAHGSVHIVRLLARGDRYAFEPAELRAMPGDVVRFVHTGHQPESVAFDLTALPPGGAEFLQEQGVARGPLLTEPGAVHDVHLRDAPEGRYPFFSLPHAELGMRGVLIVGPEEAAAAP